MDPFSGLAADARTLDRLKLDASKDPRQAIRRVATQFEALFMQTLLKSMREAVPKSGLVDGSALKMYEGMLDQQLSQHLTGRPGGLADIIARQLGRNAGLDAAPVAGMKLDPASLRATGGPGLAMGLTPGGGSEGTADANGLLAGQGAAVAGQPSPIVARWQSQADARTGERQRQAALAAAAAAGPVSEGQGEFVRRLWDHAAVAQRSTGIPAHYVVGQAALESGWGRREIRLPDGSRSHNVFGIKAGREWRGRTVDVTTTEYIDGRPQRLVQRFRAYDTYADAFRDWSALIGGQPRYGGVMRAAGAVGDYARGMQKAGYATDPEYGAKLERAIHKTLAIRRGAM